ncbi:MAG: hypothetical protein ABL879_07220 [Devosia sp.]
MEDKLQARFAKQLHELMAGLQVSRREPELRMMIGSVATRFVNDAKARGWADLKQRIDSRSYDILLKSIQDNGNRFAKEGNKEAVRAFEAVGVSLIARAQMSADLIPVVKLLDEYIQRCMVMVRKQGEAARKKATATAKAAKAKATGPKAS